MTIVIYIPLLVCIIGLLMYFISANPKVAETGRLMFATGLLAFMLTARAAFNIR